MRTAEGRGPTLDEAVDAALIELAESRRNVDVKVLSESASETVVEVTVIEPGAANAGSATATNLLSSRKLGPERRVIVDVERYRQRRENTVREIAFRAARQVKVTGDPITLDAMQPFERRAIHLALEADPDVTTVSIGVEPERRVVVNPRKAAEQGD